MELNDTLVRPSPQGENTSIDLPVEYRLYEDPWQIVKAGNQMLKSRGTYLAASHDGPSKIGRPKDQARLGRQTMTFLRSLSLR